MKNSAAWRSLLGLAVLVMASQAAMADTTIACRRTGSLGPDLFKLNEAQHSVTIAFAAQQNDDGSIFPAHTAGPLSATFSPDSITIAHDHRYFGYSSTDTGLIDTYVINRLTASVALTNVYNNRVVGHAEWTCQVGKAQF